MKKCKLILKYAFELLIMIVFSIIITMVVLIFMYAVSLIQ